MSKTSFFLYFYKKMNTFLVKLYYHKRPLRYLLAVFLRKTNLSQQIFFENNGIKFRFFPTSFSQTLWIFAPNFVDEESIFFQQYIQPDDIIFDVGANIGSLTLIAAKIAGKNGNIIAFEPSKKIFEALNYNISLNKLANCKTYNVALGEKNGEQNWEEKNADDQSKINISQSKIKVKMSQLDEYSAPFSKIDLLKIDVEGYEYFVLKGAIETLKKTDCIYFEAKESHANHYNYNISNIIIFLKTHHFDCYLYKNQSFIKLGNDFSPQECVNIIACKNRTVLRKRFL